MFTKSVDGSGYMKIMIKLLELLDCFLEEIGEQNVVQVVSNNSSNYVTTGKNVVANV